MSHDLESLYKSTPQLQLSFLDGSGLFNCPPCIESYTTGVQSSAALFPRVIDYLSVSKSPIDGVLVCCFSDHPLVRMLREQPEITIPVLGIFQASLQAAWMLERRFGIVTTASAWEEMLTTSVQDAGMQSRCAGVVATGLGVLELESRPKDEVLAKIQQSVTTLIDNGANCIILGCAGMSMLEKILADVLPVRIKIVDGVKYGIQFLAGLVQAERLLVC